MTHRTKRCLMHNMYCTCIIVQTCLYRYVLYIRYVHVHIQTRIHISGNNRYYIYTIAHLYSGVLHYLDTILQCRTTQHLLDFPFGMPVHSRECVCVDNHRINRNRQRDTMSRGHRERERESACASDSERERQKIESVYINKTHRNIVQQVHMNDIRK